MARTKGIALFDDTHGQPNWSQTGFPSRELSSNFSGIADALTDLGFDCSTVRPRLLGEVLPRSQLLVLPPPTGYYDPERECWHSLQSSRLTATEVEAILRFLTDGGRLLAFAYRFGDSFTGANLSDLFTRLGCPLNDDAVFDVTRLRDDHPLELHFETRADTLPAPWCKAGVSAVCWRPMASFRMMPGAAVTQIALSPGGRCSGFDRVQRRIQFQSLPIAVAGRRGRGRFALFGGPHVFETGPFGLLAEADNRRFLSNVLGWLRDGGDEFATNPNDSIPNLPTNPSLGKEWRALWEVDAIGPGLPMVGFVERLLQETGILKALGRPLWTP